MYNFRNNGSETENSGIKTSTLAREHVSMQGTLAREDVSTQDTLVREHAKHAGHVSTFLARRARNLANSKIRDLDSTRNLKKSSFPGLVFWN